MISRSREYKPDVLKRFSRRTAQIEKVAQDKGITDPKRKAELGAETREKKGEALSWEKLAEGMGCTAFRR